jgi:anti-sigma regulatory factor (Ser/Thr protein kinase)
MTRAEPAPVTASLDRDGCILHADDKIMRLQIEAGGQPDGPLAVPALASVVRLALRLGTPLSRPVELARDEADISLWAQLRPEGAGVQLTLLDWQERRPRQPMSHAAALEAIAEDPASRGWNWQVDDQMRFCHLDLSATRIGHAIPEDGQTFTAFFALLDSGGSGEAGQRAMPMIEALVRHMNFEGQLACLRGDNEVRYHLSGTALFDRTGMFSGYRGHAEREERVVAPKPQAQPEPQPEPQPKAMAPAASAVAAAPPSSAPESSAAEFIGPALSRRLDTALRQPITRIIANAGTIGERITGPLRQDYANYAGDIAAAGRHLLALVDDLADLQAVEGPGFITTNEEVDLSEIARRAAGLLNIRAEARRIIIQAPAADERVCARADYRRVLQILVNLVGNAVRHSPEESTIWIRLDEVDGRARVIVADQGNGVHPEDHERIFERFERLGNTDGSGSGLGLYISRKLARAMGGEVAIESALGSGARFTLDLPAWNAHRNGSQAG